MNEHTAICGFCKNRVPLETIFEHLAIVHDFHEQPATWPDGEYVIVDNTFEPSDFEESA